MHAGCSPSRLLSTPACSLCLTSFESLTVQPPLSGRLMSSNLSHRGRPRVLASFLGLYQKSPRASAQREKGLSRSKDQEVSAHGCFSCSWADGGVRVSWGWKPVVEEHVCHAADEKRSKQKRERQSWGWGLALATEVPPSKPAEQHIGK